MKRPVFGLTMMLCSMVGSGMAFAASPAPEGDASLAACHKAFEAAKESGTLKGQDYAAFKQAHCAEGTAHAPAAVAEEGKKPTAQASAASGDALFPEHIAPEFASLSPGQARLKTCLAQYNANKSTGRNGGLRWIQRGGGYYPMCNARLKWGK